MQVMFYNITKSQTNILLILNSYSLGHAESKATFKTIEENPDTCKKKKKVAVHLNLLTPKEYIFLTKSFREYIFPLIWCIPLKAMINTMPLCFSSLFWKNQI